MSRPFHFFADFKPDRQTKEANLDGLLRHQEDFKCPSVIAVTGRQGQVARALAEAGPALNVEIIDLGRPQLDLAVPETVQPALEAASTRYRGQCGSLHCCRSSGTGTGCCRWR